MPKLPRLPLAALAAAFVVLGTPLAAAAVDPMPLGSSHVLDEADVLDSAEEASVEDAAANLYERTGHDLFVVYVDSFTNPSSPEDWANTVAEQNGLGPDDYLLAIAATDRAYYLSADQAGPVSLSDISAIEQKNIEPRLHDSDWAGAAVAAADGLGGSIEGRMSAATGWLIALGVIVAIGLVILVVVLVRRGRSRRARAESLEELEAEASRALVQSDDAVRTAEQDLGFALAQYGEDAVKPYKAAVAEASTQLREAFGLQQQLDDAIPDTDEQKRSSYARILEICTAVGTALDAQEASFDELDALAENLSPVLQSVDADIAALEQRLPEGSRLLDELQRRYAATATEAVADNVAQATERIRFAREGLSSARANAEAGTNGQAAVFLRDAKRAVAQGGQLLDAVARRRDELAAAQAEVQRLIADLDADVAAARGDGSAELAGVAAAAAQTVEDARSAAPPTDPVELASRLTEANTRMDAALKRVRDAAEAERRARASLGSALSIASSHVSQAEDFIAARRGAVGTTARTRLAEARRLLAEAQSLSQGDPTTALASAQRAAALAQQSLASAQSDLSGFDTGFGGGFGGPYATGRSSGVVDGLLGAVIGGLLASGGSSRGFGGGYRSSGRGPSFGGGRSFGGGGRSRRGGGRF
ncbi:TLP18.3, Psb32 and MOLO-1 founding protein of phosphatase [Paramicrobacterium humi]|uniref:TLP18.3, Psb32 and MOLO-1 founding protein of phosphatase n=1 Tax=Paramicrobacterium humi TaxID=640635 RepID=A0A1H4P9Y5_9MICO|nr:TPM domain-containing protein [Microbacterium humi]SEC04253.1 TLP18.3, Psb32 and MOLO-1 founding protein of phosphatase [Microbacterium humi]